MAEVPKLNVYLSRSERDRLLVSVKPSDERTAELAGWVIDALTDRYGSRPAVPDETGCIIRELAGDVNEFRAALALQGAGFDVVYGGQPQLPLTGALVLE